MKAYYVGTLFMMFCNNFDAFMVQMNRAHNSALNTALDWKTEAVNHVRIMDDLLYPPGENIKARTHLVKQHPIYNFLHTYYRYSTKSIKRYSPGLGILMEGVSVGKEEESNLNEKYLKSTAGGVLYDLPQDESPTSTFGWITLSRTRDILYATVNKQPFYGCFGLHEWAMLYSGRIGEGKKAKDRHQDLPLRVSQDTIDNAVEASSALRCTHYDAFRFFHPSAQPMNSVSMPTRDFQEENEQPGCVHAAMDLFKYAYQLYPFVSSDLLRECLVLAVTARKIDMRASPYDVSIVPDCAGPICVETPEGRREYVIEQEALSVLAAPLRSRLLATYDEALLRLVNPSR